MRKSILKIKDRIVLDPCFIASSPFSRFMGLMGKKSVPEGEGVCFPNCNSIHTFFMRIPIDVVMVNREGGVVRVLESLKPWRMLLPNFSVKHIIEMRANQARDLGIEVGTKLTCEGVWA